VRYTLLVTALGRYELITQIGQGGMAEVQLAIQRGPAGFEKLVVVKLVHENLATQKSFVDMLLDEARMAAMLKHPNVVDIYDLGEAGGRYFIAMEYLEGEPLLAVLRAGREGKRLDPLSTGRLIADTAEGLEAAHELRTMAGEPIELVHHDVSLGNIVILYNGQVKLVDFGVAKASQAGGGGPRTKVQGKFSYMAPEKLRGDAGDRRSDLWSLGCVLWEALTLRRLFKGGNDTETMRQVLETTIVPPSQVNGEVPTDFDPIVMRALARAPKNRYATAKEMAHDLEEVLREHKYGGKNDVIARYMQTTFETHIAARKKLLQEVSSKGRASPDILEAAFTEPAMASGSPVNAGEFAVTFKRSGEHPVVTPEGTPARTGESGMRALSGVDGAPRPRRDSVMPAMPAVTGTQSGLLRARPITGAPRSAEGPPPVGGGTIARPTGRRTRILAIAGGALLLMILGIALASRGSSPASKVAPSPTPPPPPTPTPVPVVVPPPAPDAAIADQAGSAGSDSEIVMDPNEGPGSGATGTAGSASTPTTQIKPKVDRPPPVKVDVETLFKQGLQSYVAGDAPGAISTFKRAVAVNPGFAPTWRALGHAYEKIGDKSSAKAAFRRYLQLSPNALDASSVRARMDAL